MSRNSYGSVLALLAAITLSAWLHSPAAKAAAVTPMPGDPLAGNGKVSRTLLTYAELFSTEDARSPVDDAAFSVPSGAAMPTDVFEGSLQLTAPEGRGDGVIVYTPYEQLRRYSIWKHLPHFDVGFVQNGSYLIPVRQGLVITGSPVWNLIIGPGRVWREDDDRGYSRASLPFSLSERSQNCVHNGSMTFLFSNTKTPRISQVRYQVTQETCGYMKVDMWGQVAATYSAAPIPNSTEVKNRQAEEMEHRIPRKPLSALLEDYPNAKVDLSAFLRGRKFPKDVTLYGLYVNGIHYASGCPTRYGEYAFCSEMRVPSYSTAKSAFVGIAMMRLGALYGKGVYSQKLQDYLPQVGQGDSWANVTFDDTINMATGHFVTSGYETDENGPLEMKFLGAEQYDEKMKDALTLFPRKADPGTVWNYQSHNTFLVTQAMTAFLDKKRGSGSDLFNLVRDDIYKPIHLSQGMLTTIRTDDSESGKPDGYFGLFYIQDDVIKIADFLNRDGGKIHGKTLLDPQRLRQSLFRDPSTTGLVAPNPARKAGTVHYNHAFWAKHFAPDEFPSLSCDFWAPYMSGYGGISILMLPNGTVFYVFSDAYEFNFEDAVVEINKLKPFCSR